MSTDHCKLAAVLFADMVGYSAKDPDRALKSRRAMMTLAAGCLADCQGRLIKTAGDEIFAEFPSGSAAIDCARRLQVAVADFNAKARGLERFHLRIGINTGEVTMEGTDLIGSVVNLAKRAEQMAAPGGICITEPVWRSAGADLQAGFTRLGAIPVKADLPRQVFFHRYGAETGAMGKIAHQVRLRHARFERGAVAAALLLLVAAGVRLAWPETDPDQMAAAGLQQLQRFDLPQQMGRAIRNLETAQRLKPTSAKATAGLAWAQWLESQNTGDSFLRGEAVRNANQALALNTNVVYADVVLGLNDIEMGANPEAVRHLRRANDHSQWADGGLIARLADATRLAGDRRQALELAQRSEAKAGAAWDAWHQLGVFWYQENDFSNSLRCFDRAAGVSPPSAKSAEQAMKVLLQTGNAQAALDRLTQFKNQHQNSAEVWDLYGNALLSLGFDVSAYQAFRRAAELDPTNYLHLGNAGLALFHAMTNAPEWTRILKNDAIDPAQGVLRDAPGNLRARTELATYEAALGEKSSGLSQMEREGWNRDALTNADYVLSQNPSSPDLLIKLELPYDILEREDRKTQCEARIAALLKK